MLHKNKNKLLPIKKWAENVILQDIVDKKS